MSTTLYICLILCIIYLLRTLQLYLYNRRYKPKPWFTLPIIGDNFLFYFTSQRHLEPILKARLDNYGPRSRLSLFGKEMFVVAHPQDAKFVLTSPTTHIDHWTFPTQAALSTGALTAVRGEKHTILRRLLSKLFSSKYLSIYCQNMWDIMDIHVDKWLNEEGGKNGKIVTMQKLLKSVAFDIVYGCMIDMDMVKGSSGGKNGGMKEVCGWYEMRLYGLMSLPVKIKGWGFAKGIEANEKLKRHVIELMNEFPLFSFERLAVF